MAKKKNVKDDTEKIFIGRKKAMSYVMAAMMVLNEKPVKILARGRSISRAVDVAEILINKFAPGSTYGEISISTETLTNDDNTETNVSSMEIEVIPAKK